MKQYKCKRGHDKLSRRNFMKAAVTTAAFTIIPRYVLGGPGQTPPSERVNIAFIGLGFQGPTNLKQLSMSNNVVALCDLDENSAAETFSDFPNVKKYKDFRKMLDKQKDIEGVVISTPDHTHAVIAMAVMKMGKHVYCEKPLTHYISEARHLTEFAREAKVATQMGNHFHSSEPMLRQIELIQAGVIGKVRHVHVWTSRPHWPQGLLRPSETPPVPSTLDWDLWIGPAPYRPYNPCYHPFKWRGWWDFGTGALGDIACHIVDPVYRALNLGKYKQISVEAISSVVNESGVVTVNHETYPRGSMIRYEFPKQCNLPAVKMTWYDGGLKPFKPQELEEQRKLPDDGILYVGDNGKILTAVGGGPRLIPESRMKQTKLPEPYLPRSEGHRQEWAKACKGGPVATSNFDCAGPLTEMVLTGNLSLRVGKKLVWDQQNLKVLNLPEANKYVEPPEYRKGWTL